MKAFARFACRRCKECDTKSTLGTRGIVFVWGQSEIRPLNASHLLSWLGHSKINRKNQSSGTQGMSILASLFKRNTCTGEIALPCQHRTFAPQTCQLLIFRISWMSDFRLANRFVEFLLYLRATRRTHSHRFPRSVCRQFWLSNCTQCLWKEWVV